MNAEIFCAIIDALMGDKDEQVEMTKAHNHEKLLKKLKVLENITSSKRGTIIATKCSDVVWSNDYARMNRINFVK